MPPAAETLLRLAAHLRRLLPTGIVVEASSEASVDDLWPEEASVTREWAPHRRTQFAGGRACARRALDRLGYSPVPILFDGEGAPMWPPGVVGSISHKRQHCVAIVALSAAFTSLGVDLERDGREPMEGEIVQRVCRTASELAELTVLEAMTQSPGTLFLSAKEAFFKFQFPLTKARLDWGDVELAFDQNRFIPRLRGATDVAASRGVFAIADGWLASACF